MEGVSGVNEVMGRPRRSCLTVPGSSERFLAKAAALAADEVILDLEDSVAAAAKVRARDLVARAVAGGDWTGRVLAVRVNDATSRWAYRDVIEVTERSGGQLDAIVLPKVSAPAHVVWLDLLLGQIEQAGGLSPGAIAIEAQIEDAAGLAAADAIAAASPRIATLIFGPGDFMASVGMRSLRIGGRPEGYAGGDALYYPLMRILLASRAAGLQAIDGPHAAIGDTEGLAAEAASAAALGFDGKWVVHPDQIEAVNAAFTPSQQQYDQAERILDAYAHATGAQRGAVMLDGEMIDEASRKLALATAARGRAAGLARRLPTRRAEHRSEIDARRSAGGLRA
jgi:citrate lyase subunit beta/citryl-CoA lyase